MLGYSDGDYCTSGVSTDKLFGQYNFCGLDNTARKRFCGAIIQMYAPDKCIHQFLANFTVSGWLYPLKTENCYDDKFKYKFGEKFAM